MSRDRLIFNFKFNAIKFSIVSYTILETFISFQMLCIGPRAPVFWYWPWSIFELNSYDKSCYWMNSLLFIWMNGITLYVWFEHIFLLDIDNKNIGTSFENVKRPFLYNHCIDKCFSILNKKYQISMINYLCTLQWLTS